MGFAEVMDEVHMERTSLGRLRARRQHQQAEVGQELARIRTGEVLVRVVWLFFFWTEISIFWLRTTTIPFPCHFFYLFFLRGRGRAQTNLEVNFRTLRITCPLLLTICSYFPTYPPTYLPTHILFSGVPVGVVVVGVRSFHARE